MSQSAVLSVAVVGHTNTGKTSLMRTLLRDVDFGEVSDRPAVTRAVEAAVLAAGTKDVLRLFDTPGLEDSIGLLETLDEIARTRGGDGIDQIRAFLDGPDASDRFAQEAKALRQVLEADIALYVIDVRDEVLGKHRDELTILGRCARPVVPVLNFTADEEARTDVWRRHLARVNMHAVAEFDTVLYSFRDESRLYEKLRTLLDHRGDALELLVKDRQTQRRRLTRASAHVVAELLIDVAARSVRVASDDSDPATIDALKEEVRKREHDAVSALLILHRFRREDVEAGHIPITGGTWGLDLFSSEALKQFGLRAGSGAATGAMIGLTADVILGGLSLGTATAAGAAIGGLISTARLHGRRVVDRMRGYTELRCREETLELLAVRQLALIDALFRRGHASLEALRLDELSGNDARRTAAARLPRSVVALFARARVNPGFSTLGKSPEQVDDSDPDRADLEDALTAEIETIITSNAAG